jgi:hypothetical protein
MKIWAALTMLGGLAVGCGGQYDGPTPFPSVGPAFVQVSEGKHTPCGPDVCMGIGVQNVGSEAGPGQCLLSKVRAPGKGPAVEGPTVDLPSIEPGTKKIIDVRWPNALDPVIDGNAFALHCTPGPSS